MDDKYTFLRIVEQTSTSSVYEVMCKSTKRHLSIRRFYAPVDGCVQEWKQAFYSIMSQLARVQHTNVSQIIEADIDADGAYMITDYASCSKLHIKYSGGMQIEDFQTFVSHGLCALSALHEKQLIHGRIGYDSFELQHLREGHENFLLKDYGIRKIAPFTEGKKRTNEMPSNPVFSAPEHFENGFLDEKTDLYMFGQLCYVMLAGFHPIAGKTVAQAREMHLNHSYPMLSDYLSNIPSAIVNWIERLTQPNAEDRPESAEAALIQFYQIAPKPVETTEVRTHSSALQKVTLAS